jgi:DNA transformation protein and related proteins
MAVSNDFLNFLLDQLSGWGEVSLRRMFGGAGLYREEKIFGVVAENVAYLKVDDVSRGDIVKAGSKPFNPYPEKNKAVIARYYEIPPDVLEDRDELCRWAQRAVEVQGESSRQGP